MRLLLTRVSCLSFSEIYPACLSQGNSVGSTVSIFILASGRSPFVRISEEMGRTVHCSLRFLSTTEPSSKKKGKGQIFHHL